MASRPDLDDVAKMELLNQLSLYKHKIIILKNNHDGNSEITTVDAYQSLLHNIREIYTNYCAVQSEIALLDSTDVADSESFENSYREFETMILNRMYDITKSETSNILDSELPKINVPKFSGMSGGWIEFRNAYNDLVHEKITDNLIKLKFLISHIREGRAYLLVKHVPIKAENYEKVWAIICDTYNNNILMQRIHVMALYDVAIPIKNSWKSLQLFVDHVVEHYRILKSLNEAVDSWEMILFYHLTNQLDSCSHEAIMKVMNVKQELTFNEFIEKLQARVQLLKEAHELSSIPRDEFKIKKKKRTSSVSSSRDSLRFTNILNKRKTKPLMNSQVILGTVVLNATKWDGTKISVRALLDSGSHINVITEELCNILNLKRKSTTETVSGMGGDATVLKYKVVVPITSRINNYSQKYTCHTVNSITNGALPQQPIKCSMDQFKNCPPNFELADPFYCVPDGISMLIGAEFYHELFTGKTIKISNELPPFHETVFGYVACGKMNVAEGSSSN